MGQKKLQRFEELKTFPNVLQYPGDMKGRWKHFFRNNNPIVLELACGKGEYTVSLARMYPEKNFIGIDIKGNRIWVGAKKALNENLSNSAFLRTQIDQLNDYFSEKEVEEIWLTFPDPQLRTSKAKKRLTHPKFLRIYQQILRPGGFIHLKTDSPALYRFTLLVIKQYHCILHEEYKNLYGLGDISEELKIKTYYESLDIAESRRVHYIKFSLPDQLPGKEKDKKLQEILKQYEVNRS